MSTIMPSEENRLPITKLVPLPIQTSDEEQNLWESLLRMRDLGDYALEIPTETLLPPSFSYPMVLRNVNGTRYLYTKKDILEIIDLEERVETICKSSQSFAFSETSLSDVLQNLSDRYSKHSGKTFELTLGQKLGIQKLLSTSFHILAGGPGTGKTSVVAFALSSMFELGILPKESEVTFLAPTGRAAQRLTESLQKSLSYLYPNFVFPLSCKGQTIHSLLGLHSLSANPKFGKERALPQKLFILDEVSMMDVRLMKAFLNAIRNDSKVYLLGDPNQLPSVDRGNVLSDLLSALSREPKFVSYLTESKRFEPTSFLSRVSLRLQTSFNETGSVPTEDTIDTLSFNPEQVAPKDKNLFWIKGLTGTESPSKLRKEALEFFWKKIYIEHAKIVSTWNWNQSSLQDSDSLQKWESLLGGFRCLTIFREGYYGASSFQTEILRFAEKSFLGEKGKQKILSRFLGSRFFYAGMPILLERNDSSRKIFNGDLGLVVPIGQELRAVFSVDNQLKSFALDTLPEVQPAFFLTVHKSQGSEYNRVLLYLPPFSEKETDNHFLLQRQILFTAITRAKEEVLLVGDPKSWSQGLKIHRNRITGFKRELRF